LLVIRQGDRRLEEGTSPILGSGVGDQFVGQFGRT
jgi:hypothetical protein